MLGRPKFVLASGSPRRLSLLNQAGIEPDALRPADVDETPKRGELPRVCATRLARAKADAALKSVQLDDDLRGAYILAADTVVAVSRRILPKAELVDEAVQCLRLLSGRHHRVYTAICLVTGSIWGRPTWGTWWVWDGRLTSMLVLLFLYFGYIALADAASRQGSGNGRVAAIFGLVGAINVPIINRSVVWWNSLHQPPSITLGKSAIDASYLWPLLAAAVGFSLIFGGVVLARMRAILADAQADARLRRKAMGNA